MKTKLLSILAFTLVINTTKAQSQYFIVFKANPETSLTMPGHAFASFVKKDRALNQTVIEHTWGFHPVNKSYKAIFSTEGEIEITKIGDLGKSDFVIETDQVTYEYAKKLKDRWNNKRYGILKNQNCVDFVRQLAEVIIPDIDIPSIIYKLPRPFLDHLRNLNSKRDKESRESLSTEIENIALEEKSPLYSNAISIKNEANASNKSEPHAKQVVQKTTNILGASNPEALGILLLNALINNDKSIWLRCLHPDRQERIGELEYNFGRERQYLNDKGLTDWKQVQFSRVTYSRLSNNDNILLPDFIIEFRYKKNEFIGAIKFKSVATVSKTSGKYFISGVTTGSSLERSSLR